MNDKKLIECVRQHVVLYDLSDPKYMDTNAKNEIWVKIGAEMNIDGNACKNRWGNIRDTYRKSLKRSATKSGQAAKNVKVYKYAEQLGFLKRYFDKQETVSNISVQEEVQEELGFHVENTSENQFSQPEETEYSVEEKDVQCTPQAPKPPLQPAHKSSVKSVATKKLYPAQESASSQLINYIIKTNEAPKTQEDQVDVFLNAMAPSLKRLSLYDWHLAKSEIFNTVQKYELQSIMNQQNLNTYDNCLSPSNTNSVPGSSANSSVSTGLGREGTPPSSFRISAYFGEFE